MVPTPLKVATWNIGGGILGESHQRGVSPSLDYYASFLVEHRPDVLCLQEAHDYHGRQVGQAEYLAKCLGYPHFASFPTSASHMAENASLALGVVSRFPIDDAVYKQFPNPGLSIVRPDGQKWSLHDKGYVVARLDLDGQPLGLITGHCFPLHHFGISPTEPMFAQMWEMLRADLLTVGGAGPTVAAVDLNHARLTDILSEVLHSGHYFNAFDATPTTPFGMQKDYILYGQAIRLLTTTVATTDSDHSYCQASFLV
ncbi:endonuclease/exonuclease/phosphatase family protein [Micromonospora sp. NBC_01392]|uniref:endonuclease/exonuclease/phosphatase family protein n=1 Tax=Micromonospora sp. NBC_01392 TaxID=2903588 RepID=UPI00324DF14B